MKILNVLIGFSILILISGCLPDSFTKWNLEPPSSSSSGSGATDPNAPDAPTSFAYTPSGPYLLSISNDASDTISDLIPVSTGGGEITEESVSEFGVTPSLPTSLNLDKYTGVISGRATQFTNNTKYTITLVPENGAPAITSDIYISIATTPETIYYPQKQGQILLLEVTDPQNFQVNNSLTSDKNAKGIVTTVDTKNKIIYISVTCNLTAGQTNCPIFSKDDKIDNKSSYFLEQSTITKVVYGFTLSSGIQNLSPVTNVPSNESAQYAITPDITTTGVSFNSTNGTISGTPSLPIPNTQYTVTVKNILGQTANAILNIQVLNSVNPTSPDSMEYAFNPGNRVALEVENTKLFYLGGVVVNQRNTIGTIRNFIVDPDLEGSGTAVVPGTLLIDINSNSTSTFKKGESVDNGSPYVLPVTSLSNSLEPFRVHEIGKSFSASPTLGGNADPLTLTWTSIPELPHLCKSIASTPTVYYPEDTLSNCEGNNGTCSISKTPNTKANCIAANPNPGTWTTSADLTHFNKYKDELWFNRRTGKFGADMPTKAFPTQTFEVSVTSLTGVVLKNTTSFSFQDVPKNLTYADEVLLEVDDYSAFDIGDQVSSDGTGVGVVTYKFTATMSTSTYGNILVVRTSAGTFLDGEDIDNVYPFTYQKGEIIKAKYNNLGIQVNNSSNFKIDDVVSSSSATGIVNYIEQQTVGSNTQNALWVRLIDTKIPLKSFTTVTIPTITGQPSGASSNVTGIIGSNLTINQSGGTTFAAGMDVATAWNVTPAGFGMVNSGGADISVSVEKGKFVKNTALFRLNPSNTTAAGQGSSNINEITHNPIFYLDRYSTSGINLVIDSPANNGVTYSITPSLPKGLDFNGSTGEITTVDPGPVAANLKNYTVVASNYLGSTAYSFGLAVREVFSVSDITNETGNISAILHKSSQGYSRFPCRITQSQIKAVDASAPPAGWASRAKNINCLYDVGEGELFNNGIQLKVNVGTDLCTFVEHVPYFFYQQEYVKTSTTTENIEHTGDWADVSCGPGQPGGTPIQYPDGDPASKCEGNQQGVQCDDGSVPTNQRNYTLTGVCYNTATAPSGETTLETCYNNHAACTNAGFTTRDTCLSNKYAWNSNHAFINNTCRAIVTAYTDVVSCQDNLGTCTVNPVANTNRGACTTAGGSWTPSGAWVDRAQCVGSNGVRGAPHSCGGEQINCINGPGKDFLSSSTLTGRFSTALRGQAIRVTDDSITFTYKSPQELEYQTNLYLSNYSRDTGAPACTPFNGNNYEYDMSTWFNVGKNRNPSTQGNNAPFAGGNGVYAIRCLDKSANIIGQLNILVREWDLDFKAKDGTDIMNLSGGSLDGTTNNEFGYPQNTYEDWDNREVAGGSCSIPTYNYPADDL